jgi:hypothetical protein
MSILIWFVIISSVIVSGTLFVLRALGSGKKEDKREFLALRKQIEEEHGKAYLDNFDRGTEEYSESLGITSGSPVTK